MTKQQKIRQATIAWAQRHIDEDLNAAIASGTPVAPALIAVIDATGELARTNRADIG